MAHDLTVLDSQKGFFYLGHAIEAFWFVMDDAVRRNDSAQVELACTRIMRHCSVAWDPLHGGLYRGMNTLSAHGDYATMNDKVGWVHQEALLAVLMVLLHCKCATVRAWAQGFWTDLHAWVMDKFPLKKHGYKLWMVGGERDLQFQEQYSFGGAGLKSRKENYHHPRYLMYAAQIAKKLQAQQADTSTAPPHIAALGTSSAPSSSSSSRSFTAATCAAYALAAATGSLGTILFQHLRGKRNSE